MLSTENPFPRLVHDVKHSLRIGLRLNIIQLVIFSLKLYQLLVTARLHQSPFFQTPGIAEVNTTGLGYFADVHSQNEIGKIRKMAKAMGDEYSSLLPFTTQSSQSTEDFCFIPA